MDTVDSSSPSKDRFVVFIIFLRTANTSILMMDGTLLTNLLPQDNKQPLAKDAYCVRHENIQFHSITSNVINSAPLLQVMF